jgi:Family of unknown function (DUF5681)
MTQDSGDDNPEAEAEPYEVGYGKPPKATRFKPGQSGNPGGRPKGSGKPKITNDVAGEKWKALVREEAYRPIQIRDGDRLVVLPVMQAGMRSLALNAAKGNQRAQRMLIDLLGAVEGEDRKTREMLFDAVLEYKLHWEEEIALARRNGLPEPSPLPHPDDLIVNPFVGSVVSRGPWTEEEKRLFDWLVPMKQQSEEELDELTTKAKRDPRNVDTQGIASHRKTIARIDALLNVERVIIPGLR